MMFTAVKRDGSPQSQLIPLTTTTTIFFKALMGSEIHLREA